MIGREIFLDLRLVVGALVDRDADLAARAGHRLGLQPGELALDVEVADLAEIEEPLVELRPLVHPAAMHIVRQVIDVGEPDAFGLALDARQVLEVDVVDRAALAVAVDQIDQRIADALDGRDVELHRPDLALDAPGAQRLGALVGEGRVLHPEGDGADRGAVHAGKALGEAVPLGVDDEVHVALAIERDVLGAVLGDLHEAHALEQRAQRRRIGRRVLDELEAVGAHGIDLVDRGNGGFHYAGHVDLRIDRVPELVSNVTIMPSAFASPRTGEFSPLSAVDSGPNRVGIAARPVRRTVRADRDAVAGDGGARPLRAFDCFRCGAAHRHGQGGGEPGGGRTDAARPGRAGDRPRRPPPRLAPAERPRPRHARPHRADRARLRGAPL